MEQKKMRIAVLGAGNVGGALARLWAASGHEVVFGVPNPRGQSVARAIAGIKSGARAATNAEAIAEAG